MATEPGNLATRFELAETLLLQGDFTRGWREYRYRYSMPHTVRIERKIQRPRWDGEPIRGKTLLIHDEQGYGDTFQFLRMVAWARARSGARVVLQINAEQLPFAERAGGYDAIVARGELPPPFDFHCEMMSLPMAMNLQLQDLPGTVPYLSANPERIEHWRRRLAALPAGPRVALFWSGRPTHFNDAARSMSLVDLAPLAIPGITFLSLQKGEKAAQAHHPPPGMHLVPIADETQDFEDTAAVLSLCDLLISVDSSPVHLAGALGCRCGSCSRSCTIGAGCSIAPTVLGIRAHACFASSRRATGRESWQRSRRNSPSSNPPLEPEALVGGCAAGDRPGGRLRHARCQRRRGAPRAPGGPRA